MLPYFKYTEDVQNFCHLMDFTLDIPKTPARYVCMYSMEYHKKPHITSYNLDLDMSPLIPPDKVIDYLTLMLNGYSCEEAVNELNIVG